MRTLADYFGSLFLALWDAAFGAGKGGSGLNPKPLTLKALNPQP